MRVVRTEKQMKEVEVTLEYYSLCDKCNCKIENDTYDAFECEIIHKTGNCYPESGDGEAQTVELCDKCAIELVELLKTNGYRITDSKWDY